MTKLEIIFPKSMENTLIEILKKNRIGFSIVDNVRGMGESGMRDGLGLSNAFLNVLFIIIVAAEQVDFIIENVKPICQRAGGIIMETNIKLWSRQ